MIDDYADLKQLRLTPEMLQQISERKVSLNTGKIRRNHEKFIKVPWSWFERLKGASGQTYSTALTLLWLHWRNNSGPIKLANSASGMEGISRHAKYRALTDLERRGLITVTRRERKSPIVNLNL